MTRSSFTASGPAPRPFPPTPFYLIVGLSAPHSRWRPVGGRVRAWIFPTGVLPEAVVEWGRGRRGARTQFSPLLRYFWSRLGWETRAAASELTWATWGRRRRRAGLLGGGAAPKQRSACRPHLLASVSSDERRYVNPFAAGKWRAGPDQRPRSRDAAQEAEAGGGAEPWRRAAGGVSGLRGGGAGWRECGRRECGRRGSSGGYPRPLPTRRFRVAFVFAAHLSRARSCLSVRSASLTSLNLVHVGKVFLKKSSCSDECGPHSEKKKET